MAARARSVRGRGVRDGARARERRDLEADPETERMLLDAIAQCERGDTVPLPQLLAELRSRESASLSPSTSSIYT